ncbi:MAG: hypothetical protein QOG43_236 [Actinomycetota bacterium]|nr:hypothetical protein [Actinomycetota bacterium]
MTHVTTIDGALKRMAEIGDMVEVDPDDPSPPPPLDGLVCFNHLYTRVTREVDAGVKSGLFGDGKFMTALDVAFANRYFEAIAAWDEGRLNDVPRVWEVLFDRRRRPGIASIQFAVAGVNAHINLDLAVALVSTCTDLGVPLNFADQRVQYEEINNIFDRLFARLREDFTSGRFERIDKDEIEHLLDRVSRFVVDKARDFAWMSAEQLAKHQEHEGREGADSFANILDRGSALAAHLLI